MSSEYTKIMLNTLRQHPRCDINLTFYTKDKYALLSVNHKDRRFHVTHLVTDEVQTFEDIESTISAIDESLEQMN